MEAERHAIVACQAGSPEAFGYLVETYRSRAFRAALMLVRHREDALDVSQEAFVKAYRGLQGFRGEAALETWFYRILVRQAHSHRRWRAVREFSRGGASDDPPDPSPSAPGDPALRRRIAAALDGLTRSQRETFVLVHLEGFRVRECAEVLGKPVGTVKSHLHRALASLRRELADLRDPQPTPDEEEPT